MAYPNRLPYRGQCSSCAIEIRSQISDTGPYALLVVGGHLDHTCPGRHPGRNPVKELAVSLVKLYCTKDATIDKEAGDWTQRFRDGSLVFQWRRLMSEGGKEAVRVFAAWWRERSAPARIAQSGSPLRNGRRPSGAAARFPSASRQPARRPDRIKLKSIIQDRRAARPHLEFSR
jgi:hypothetical protein